MAKNTSKKNVAEAPKGAVVEGNTLSINPDDTEFRKPGKVRTGKMVDGEIVYDEEKPEEPTPEAPLAPKAAKVEKPKVEKPKVEKKKVEGGSAEVLDSDTIVLKPSQRPTPPAHLRKVVTRGEATEFVTINDLVEKYGMDGKKIRRIVRNCGYKAPPTETQGFGAKARYEFDPNSEVFKKIVKALDEEVG